MSADGPGHARLAAEALLHRVGMLPDAEIDLAEAALALAVLDRPDLSPVPYRAHLGDLARDLAGRGAASIEQRVLALRAVMVDTHGYRGDEDNYDALENADLARVIDRRRGLPVALSILWLHAARACGWNVIGLNVPGHFMIRLDAADGAAIVDPFNRGHTPSEAELRKLLSRVAEGGRTVNLEDCPPIGNRATLLRLQNNIKLRLLQAEQPARAVAVVERMLMIAPDQAVLWREAGLLHGGLGNLRAGRRCLERALELAEGAQAYQNTAAELNALRTRLN